MGTQLNSSLPALTILNSSVGDLALDVTLKIVFEDFAAYMYNKMNPASEGEM